MVVPAPQVMPSAMVKIATCVLCVINCGGEGALVAQPDLSCFGGFLAANAIRWIVSANPEKA